MKPQTINVNFDGTCVTHEFPKIGKEIGAVSVLKKLVANGHKLILFTMRSGKYLDEAVEWFNSNEIPLYGIQTNPTQYLWTKSPKSYANLMIDDSSLGCPLRYDDLEFESDEFKQLYPNEFLECFDGEKCVWKVKRPYVDWEEVELMLIKKGLL
jgi:hypothetical protein